VPLSYVVIVLKLGGHTFPIGLGGVNTNVRLSVRHLCEDQKEMLGLVALVELAQALFVPTGLEFASGPRPGLMHWAGGAF